MNCLYPDCTFTGSGETEQAKRGVIDHINQAHDDAHVIIACAHDLTLLEQFIATTKSGDTGALLEFVQQRMKCERCGQFEVRDVPEDAT